MRVGVRVSGWMCAQSLSLSLSLSLTLPLPLTLSLTLTVALAWMCAYVVSSRSSVKGRGSSCAARLVRLATQG